MVFPASGHGVGARGHGGGALAGRIRRHQKEGLMNIGRCQKAASIRHSTPRKAQKLEVHSEVRSEAFPVNNGRAGLIVLTLGDPHLLESAQRRQDRATNPHRVFALWWGHDLDLHSGWCQSCELFCHALTDSSEHCGSTREHDIAVKIFANIHVALHDGLECGVVDSTGLLADEAWLEEHFRAAETL